MKGSFTPMPIPFLEALRGRLAPVFNVPLERKKEIITSRAWLACQGLDSTAGTKHKSATQTFTATKLLCVFNIRQDAVARYKKRNKAKKKGNF